ncbi:MAG: hypothetical protein HOP11_07525 [Saprospiraceae bacterium]|nr:hypothetical protein [Saprospiraceae bacterium]
MNIIKNNLFLELFYALSDAEINNFTKFLRSNTSNSDFVSVIHLLPRLKNKDLPDLKLRIHSDIYPDEKYKDVRIRLLFSDLFKELKSFIHQTILDNDMENELQLLQFFRRRRIDRLFEIQSEKISQQLTLEIPWNEKKYEHQYIQELEKLKYETSKSRYNPANFSTVLQNFEIHVLIQRLRLYLEHLTFRQFGSELKTFPEMETQIRLTLQQDWTSITEVNLYILAIKLFSDFDDDDNYNIFIAQLIELSKHMNLETRKELFSLALNYCIRKINKDHEEYFEKTLQLYEHGVKEEWLLEHGVMNQVTYKNIITLCIRSGKFSLAEEKLLRYKDFVNKKDRESIYQFNHARILKEKGQTRDALILLYSNRYKDPLIEIHARIEMIKIYYEIQEEQLLLNQIKSTEKFINKSEQLGYHKKYYFNFCSYTRLLITFRSNLQLPKKLKELQIKLFKEVEVIEKSWLSNEVHKLLSANKV